MPEDEQLARHREQVARILASDGFTGSRHASEFLQYTAQCVLEGRAPAEQVEIAEKVLGRKDFDPTTDAAVRKLAMQVRQRLERYYLGTGRDDEILVTLPLRSYSPHFEVRQIDVARAAPPARRVWPPIVAAAVASSLVTGTVVWWSSRSRPEPDGAIRIVTEHGDITYPIVDAAPGAVRLGAPLGPADEVAVCLTFRPQHESQHAGLVVWEGPQRYVSLGRRFTSRNVLTFGMQYDSYFDSSPQFAIPDPEGQSGAPVWLRLVKEGGRYRALWSADGSTWRQLGGELVPPRPLRDPRPGVFAVNGRRNSPSAEAVFRWPGVGPLLPRDPAVEGPWSFQSNCSEPEGLVPEAPSAAGPAACSASWSRAVPEGEWSLSTRIDFPATPGRAAGLFLKGANGRVRLVRYHAGSASISFILDGKHSEASPDSPGSPAVYLRLRSERGRLVGEWSIDGLRFRPAGSAALDAVGKPLSFGSVASRHGGQPDPKLPVVPRFYFVQQDLTDLRPR